jgi:hypothetical protein
MSMQRAHNAAQREAGVTIIELVIAVGVLSVGLLAMAQLFIVATLNNAFAANTSSGVADAQRLIEAYKSEAATNGITSAIVTSGTYDEATRSSPAVQAATGAPPSVWYKESVWVFDKNGALVTTPGIAVSPASPPEFTGALASPSERSRLVVVRYEPKTSDSRYSQTVVLTSIIRGK